ncbi:MAG: hypothetical protein ACRESZ_09475, partial [Methylococcales bacterium]
FSEESTMNRSPSLQVAVEVGSRAHYGVIGPGDGGILDECTIAYSPSGFDRFFQHIERQERLCLRCRSRGSQAEGHNGWARPLDNEVRRRGVARVLTPLPRCRRGPSRPAGRRLAENPDRPCADVLCGPVQPPSSCVNHSQTSFSRFSSLDDVPLQAYPSVEMGNKAH